MAYKTFIKYTASKTPCYITDTVNLYVNSVQKATLFSSVAQAKRTLKANKIPLKNVKFYNENVYFGALRSSLIKDIKEIVVSGQKVNEVDLLCLIASMTDKRLKEFHTEILYK